MTPKTYMIFWIVAMGLTWAVGIGIMWQLHRAGSALLALLDVLSRK